MEITNLTEDKISETATIYAEAFNTVYEDENWSIKQAEKFIKNCLEHQEDLFFIAIDNNEVVGGMWGRIVPKASGNSLCETELFVNPKHHKKGIAGKLLEHIIRVAIDKYQIQTFTGVALGEADFPMGWYEKIGFKKTKWVFVYANAKEVLKNLTS